MFSTLHLQALHEGITLATRQKKGKAQARHVKGELRKQLRAVSSLKKREKCGEAKVKSLLPQLSPCLAALRGMQKGKG